MTYYNEHDPGAAEWLRQLADHGQIPPGTVDERDVRAVRASDLAGAGACHFFAGIGGWPLALRLAGWPEDEEVWTGSCPCQPFSVAGKRRGEADERHLWPVWHGLITECRPPTVFGEQVAGPDGRRWFARVRRDMEALGYAVGAADLCAAGLGAPHARQRLFFVANAQSQRRQRWAPRLEGEKQTEQSVRPGAVGMGDAHRGGRAEGQSAASSARHGGAIDATGGPLPLADADGAGLERDMAAGARLEKQTTAERSGVARGWEGCWDDWTVVECRDGLRRTQPGLFPLAHGIPNRVGLLRGYGNAIVPAVGAVFIQAAAAAILGGPACA